MTLLYLVAFWERREIQNLPIPSMVLAARLPPRRKCTKLYVLLSIALVIAVPVTHFIVQCSFNAIHRGEKAQAATGPPGETEKTDNTSTGGREGKEEGRS